MNLRWLCSALVLCVALVGCTSSEKPATTGGGSGTSSGAKRLIFLINTPDPFWDTCNAGLKEAETQLKLADAGLSISMEANDGTAQGQIDKLRQYASQSDIVGIAISVIQADNAAIVEEMKNLQKKGVKVITVDGDVNRKLYPDARPYYIGTNNIVAGEVLGKATKAILEAKGKQSGGYVQFAGYTDNDNARNRMNGFQKGVGDAYSELDRMPDETNRTRAQDNVRNAIINHKDKLNCLVGIWAYNGPAIADVVAERKEREKFVCVTFDAAAAAIKSMEDGNMDALCVQNPFDFGFQAVRLLKAMHEQDDAVIKEMFPNPESEGGDVYTTGLRIVVPDDKSAVKPDLFDAKVVEFMTLPQFKEWLQKYKLTSS